MSPRVGVLAVQGAFALHAERLAACGATPVEVRAPDGLVGLDALVLPGGESTTMSMLLDRTGLRAPLVAALGEGLPAFGTCAGMILLATEVLDGRPDQRSLAVVDLAVRRNAFGRQVDSFEVDLDVAGVDGPPVRAVFIRAPSIERVGDDVDVLAQVDGRPVAARAGRVLVTAFHPELATVGGDGVSPDVRLHQLFLRDVAGLAT